MVDSKEIFNLLTKMYSEVQDRFNNLENRFDNLEDRFNNLETRFDKLESKVDKTNIIAENDVKPKIEALFDGYEQNVEVINILNNKIDDLQADVNNLTIRTLKNENNITYVSKTMDTKDFMKDVK